MIEVLGGAAQLAAVRQHEAESLAREMIHRQSAFRSAARAKTSTLWFILLLIALGLVGCAPESPQACLVPPRPIEQPDLVGRWSASYGGSTDELTLRADGTYVQSYLRGSDGYSFRSEGKRWFLEQSATGIGYVHLEGMRRCDDTDELCMRESGGSGDGYWLDYCAGRFLQAPDEVILLVVGETPSQGGAPSPRGIILRHLSLDSSSGSFYFTFAEP